MHALETAHGQGVGVQFGKEEKSSAEKGMSVLEESKEKKKKFRLRVGDSKGAGWEGG